MPRHSTTPHPVHSRPPQAASRATPPPLASPPLTSAHLVELEPELCRILERVLPCTGHSLHFPTDPPDAPVGSRASALSFCRCAAPGNAWGCLRHGASTGTASAGSCRICPRWWNCA